MQVPQYGHVSKLSDEKVSITQVEKANQLE